MDVAPETSFRASATIGRLTAALAEAQQQIPPIARDLTAQVTSRRTGQTYSYSYTDLATYLQVLRPILAAKGIALLQCPHVDERWVAVTTVLALGDEWIASTMRLPAPETRDPQVIGSLVSYARRYGLAALVAVAPEAEDDDAASASAVAQAAPMPSRPSPPPPEDDDGADSAASAGGAVYVREVQRRTTSKAGVTRYEVYLSDGRKASTIRDALGQRAESYQREQTPVVVDVEESRYGLNLLGINPAPDAGHSDDGDDDIPF